MPCGWEWWSTLSAVLGAGVGPVGTKAERNQNLLHSFPCSDPDPLMTLLRNLGRDVGDRNQNAFPPPPALYLVQFSGPFQNQKSYF